MLQFALASYGLLSIISIGIFIGLDMRLPPQERSLPFALMSGFFWPISWPLVLGLYVAAHFGGDDEAP